MKICKVVLAVSMLLLMGRESFAEAEVYVLCYHTFINGRSSFIDFSHSELRSHLDYLNKHGFRFVSYTDMIHGRISGVRNVLLTIDDGHGSVYSAYTDVLRPRGIKPLVAIFPGVIGKHRYVLTWRQVIKLHRAGCEIAAHGYYHRKITRGLYYYRRGAFIQEIYGSKMVMESVLQKKIIAYVYPYGVWSDLVYPHFIDAGYLSAFTITGKRVRYPEDIKKHPYEISRFMLTRGNHRSVLLRIRLMAEKSGQKYVNHNPGLTNSIAFYGIRRRPNVWAPLSATSFQVP